MVVRTKAILLFIFHTNCKRKIFLDPLKTPARNISMLLKETLDKVYIYLDIYGKPMYDKVCVVSILNLVDLLILYVP